MPRNLAHTKVVLLPAAAPAGAAAAASGATPIRRYRLARIRPADRNAADRFAHLRRTYD